MEKMKDKLKQIRKPQVDFHVNETTIMESCIPADYSFRKFKELKAIGVETGPRSTRVGRVPEKGAEHRKYLTRSIWLNNNKLTEVRNLDVFVDSVLEQPEKLGWIDFSYNFIVKLDEGIQLFPELKIVYFHGNAIKELDEVLKLRPLSNLRSVTFHGNPIADEDSYRMCIVTYLPQIVNLDFSPVTNAERLQPKPAYAVKKLEALQHK